MKFDIQKFARDWQDTTYRGNRRWSGNWGRVWINDMLIFEIQGFEAKITEDRDDVIIGQSKDSKIVSLTGEGTITIKRVLDSGISEYWESIKAGQDMRFKIVGAIQDPDMWDNNEQRIQIENVWLNEVDVMHFTKGEVVETEIPFGFTPEDVSFIKTVTSSATGSTQA